MTPEQFQRARRLFDEAVTRASDARAAFLLEACPDDPAVLAEVERLLAQETAGSQAPNLRGAIRQALGGSGRPGAVISHYRLEERVGAGGMGEVYRASDLALGREAAVKILPPGIAGTYRDRLLAEARLSARLQHPGIATFFEGGEHDGVAFLAMEYVRGETLRDRLRRGPLPVDAALRTTAALLEALAHAHAYDVIHRDIKPENVIRIEDGTVKLLDFGIAKRIDVTQLELEPETETIEETRTALTALTRHGSVVGTIGYMPPEQLRGEAVDARADLFAVGAVLYEMIAGRPAFAGKTAAQRIAATVAGDLPSLRVSEAGPDLDAVIRRALARDPAERYGSAAEFLRDVQALASGEAIAILPDTLAIVDFATHGAEDDAWIGGAVAESLAADLARVEGLKVLPREAVARARAARENGDPVGLGLALGCRWVLDGAVQRMGPSVRITHRLLEVATGNVAHTAKEDGKYDDLFALQDRLAASVAEHLHLALPESTTTRSSERDLDARECYAKGKALLYSNKRGSIDEAERWLERAIEIEPGYAEALSMLAQVHAPNRWMASTDPAELDQAEALSRRSIQADPGRADGYVWLGYALFRKGEVGEALASFDNAIERAPDHIWARYFAACANIDIGEFDRAVEHARNSVLSGAAGSFQYTALGFALMARGSLSEALWALETAAELAARGGPMTSLGAGTFTADCLLAMGRLDEARRRALETLEVIEQSDHAFRDIYRTGTLCSIARIAAAQGDDEAARAALTQCIAHLRARPRGTGLGFTLVAALAVLARIDQDPRAYDEALHLYLGREDYDFNMANLGAFHARDELVAAAKVLDREDDIERIRAAATMAAT